MGRSGGGSLEHLEQLGLQIVQGHAIGIQRQGPIHQGQSIGIAPLLAVDRQQAGEGRGEGGTALQGPLQIGDSLLRLAAQHGQVTAVAEGFAVVGPLG